MNSLGISRKQVSNVLGGNNQNPFNMTQIWQSSGLQQEKKIVPPIKVPPPPTIDLAQNSVRTDNGSIIGDMGGVT